MGFMIKFMWVYIFLNVYVYTDVFVREKGILQKIRRKCYCLQQNSYWGILEYLIKYIENDRGIINASTGYIEDGSTYPREYRKLVLYIYI